MLKLGSTTCTKYLNSRRVKGASESDNKQVTGGALNKFNQTVKIMTNFEEKKSERKMLRGWK